MDKVDGVKEGRSSGCSVTVRIAAGTHQREGALETTLH